MVVRVANIVLVRAMTRRGATLHLAAPGDGADLELGRADDYVVLGVFGGVLRIADDGRESTDGT